MVAAQYTIPRYHNLLIMLYVFARAQLSPRRAQPGGPELQLRLEGR